MMASYGSRLVNILICSACLFGIQRCWAEKVRLAVGASVGPAVDISPNIILGDRALVWGTRGSRNLLVEFFDYECGPCRELSKTISGLESRKDFGLVLRHFPLQGHKLARPAEVISANYASCHEGYLRTHHLLSSTPLSQDFLIQLGRTCGENCGCLDSSIGTTIVSQDIELGKTIPINHTPTLFLVRDGSVYLVENPSGLSKL